MAKEKGKFTEADIVSYNAIGAKDISNISNIPNIENATKTTHKRSYNRLNPREEAPEVYKINLKMSGELGRYIAAKAASEFITRNDAIIGIIEEDMNKHPEILKALNKKKKN